MHSFDQMSVDCELDRPQVPMSGALTSNVDCWMDVTRGTFPNSVPIEGPVKVGENLTMTIYVSG